MRMQRVWMSLGICAATLLLSLPAFASGFFVARFGGEHGHPTTDHLSSIYYNPAGLSLGKGTRLTIDANLAWRMFSYERPEDAIDNIFDDGASGTPREAVSANAGEATLNNFIAAPFAAVASDFGIEGFSAAVGFYAPFGGSSVYDKSENLEMYPGAADGPQRWWAIEGTIRSVYITGAAAYRIKPLRLSVGLGLNIVKSEVYTVRARNVNGTDDLTGEGRALLDVSATELSLGAGVIWEPKDGLFFGASYQSSPNFGESKLEGTAQLHFSGGRDKLETSDVEYYQTLPEVWQFGMRWRMDPKNEVRLFGNYIPWSMLEYQCAIKVGSGQECPLKSNDENPLISIPREWMDAYAVRFGASHWISPGVEFFGGGGFDANAVPDETLEPALYDTDKFTLSVGVRLGLRDGKILSASSEATSDLNIATTYTQVIYVPREIRPRGPEPDDPTRSNISQFGYEQDQRQPDAAGSYEQSIGVLNINVEYIF